MVCLNLMNETLKEVNSYGKNKLSRAVLIKVSEYHVYSANQELVIFLFNPQETVPSFHLESSPKETPYPTPLETSEAPTPTLPSAAATIQGKGKCCCNICYTKSMIAKCCGNHKS